jgi:transcriptional regulator with XRE-family HTH domain
MPSFGDRLRQVREARGWSQEKLGFECEVTKATISKWELSRAEPGLGHLSKLRQLFADDNMTLDWLIDDSVSASNAMRNSQSIREAAAEPYLRSPRLAESADELALLVRFRQLNPKQRRGLVDFLGMVQQVS